MPLIWIILTGEYPPQSGGVADYTRQVAAALAAAGDEVHVIAPALRSTAPLSDNADVHVHRLPDHFGAAGRAQIEAILATVDRPRRILLQYVPHAFGYRGMNVGFARWIDRLAKRESVDVMFHEVHFPVERGQSMRHHLLGLVTRWMARQIAVDASRRFLSTSTWNDSLRALGVTGPNRWTPVPTNLPVRAVGISSNHPAPRLRVGHFGTYGSYVVRILEPILIALQDVDCDFIMLGRGSGEYVGHLVGRHPQFASRMAAPRIDDDQQLSAAIRDCDLVIQPYPDGVSTRRGSTMASLALAVPTVTHSGASTESIWEETQAVALARSPAAADYLAVIMPLLGDGAGRQALGERGAALYANRFALEHTINALRAISNDRR